MHKSVQRVAIAKPRSEHSRIFDKVKAAGWGYEIKDSEIIEEETAAQFIDVKDYKGKGMEITKGQVVNQAEAEFVVATYMYMRLKMGVKDVVVITNEEGQKKLIEGLLRQKCGWHPMLGMPN